GGRRGAARARVGAARLGGDGDLTDDSREQLVALGVLASFAVLDIGPLGVTGHPFLSWRPSPGARDRACDRDGAFRSAPSPARTADLLARAVPGVVEWLNRSPSF